MPTSKRSRKRLIEALKSKLKKKLAAKMHQKLTRRVKRAPPVAPMAPVAPVAHAPVVAPLMAPLHATPSKKISSSPKVLPQTLKRSHKSPSMHASLRLERNLPLSKSMRSLRASVKHLAEANAGLEVKSVRQQSQRKGHSVSVIPSDIY